MKKVIHYEHFCKRCERTWLSAKQNPTCCGKCKNPRWNEDRKVKAAA